MSALGRGKKMEKKFGLSETEYELMEFFWESDRKLSFREILDYFNEIKKKDWKKQTLSSFLTILQKEGHIKTDISGKKYLYYPSRTKQKHIKVWMKQLCKESFDNSLLKFVQAFTGGERISHETAQELRDYLDQLEDKEK